MTEHSDLPLFAPPPPPKKATSFEARLAAFEQFHKDNPAVYAELVKRARMAKSRGLKRLGIRRLWEVLRWDVELAVVRFEGEPKFNNNHVPFYSRLIQAQESDLRGFFELRGEEEAGDA